MFYFWLPFQLWRLVTPPACNIISNGILYCIPRKLYFHFWLKSQSKSNRNRNCIFHSLGNPKGRTLDHFFCASHIRHSFPWYLCWWVRSTQRVVLQNSCSTVGILLAKLIQFYALLAKWNTSAVRTALKTFCEMGIIAAKRRKFFLELWTIFEKLLKLWMFAMKCT